MTKQDPYVMLAKETLELYVRTGKRPDIHDYDLPKEMTDKKAGVFVSIKTKNGQLRGCIGTIYPYAKNIAEEIVNNAISAGTRDPRFYPVREEELSDLVYSVDVLMEPEKIESLNELDVKIRRNRKKRFSIRVASSRFGGSRHAGGSSSHRFDESRYRSS